MSRALTLRSVLALFALLGVSARPLHAQRAWKAIGKTANGNAVYVDPRSVKATGELVAADVRVVFTEPVKGRKGVFASYRTSATFNCPKKSLAARENVYYADAKSTKVIDRTVNQMPGFGSIIGGSLGDVAHRHLCTR